jgi:thioesterase domain-containing protein
MIHPNNKQATKIRSTLNKCIECQNIVYDYLDSFIKSKTNVSLGEKYNELVSEHIEKVSEEEKDKIEKELMENEKKSYRERIETLTEKFKNDPTKLAVLSKLAADLIELQ